MSRSGKTMKEVAAAMTRAAIAHDKAMMLMLPEVIKWFKVHDYGHRRAEPIDRSLAKVVRKYIAAIEQMERVLAGDTPRRKSAKRR